jgi:hypothetical protein
MGFGEERTETTDHNNSSGNMTRRMKKLIIGVERRF